MSYNSNQMNFRAIKQEDLKLILSWWEEWPEWVAPAIDALPNNGLGGFLVEVDGKPVCAGFVYTSNSKIAFIEWIISDKNYREDNRDLAIEILITGMEMIIKEAGYKYIFSISRSKKLLNKFEELNYHVDKTTTSHEVIKIIN